MSATYRSDDPTSSRRSQAARLGWRRRKASARHRLDQAVSAALGWWRTGLASDDDRQRFYGAMTELERAYQRRHG